MGKTVNIYGEEIERCSECKFFVLSTVSKSICKKDKNINVDECDNFRVIHPDCPFSKSITKEVLEELGFEFVEEFINSGNLFMYTKEWFRKQTDKGDFTITILDNEKTGIEYEIEYDNNSIHREYWGKLMNVEELKFILKRLDI